MSRVLAIVVPILAFFAVGLWQDVELWRLAGAFVTLALIVGAVHLTSNGTGWVR